MSAWVTCPCGKTREVVGDELRVRLAERSFCTSCSMDRHRKENTCPEIVGMDGGASGCRLAWNHTGQCEPWMTSEELRREIAAHRLEEPLPLPFDDPPHRSTVDVDTRGVL